MKFPRLTIAVGVGSIVLALGLLAGTVHLPFVHETAPLTGAKRIWVDSNQLFGVFLLVAGVWAVVGTFERVSERD